MCVLSSVLAGGQGCACPKPGEMKIGRGEIGKKREGKEGACVQEAIEKRAQKVVVLQAQHKKIKGTHVTKRMKAEERVGGREENSRKA